MMWPRVAEMLIGLWLLASPWVLVETRPATSQMNAIVCGTVIVALSGLSLLPRWKHAHLALIPVGLWVLCFAYIGSAHPAPALVQSDLLAALFLLNFAIIPNPAALPPDSWRNFGARPAGDQSGQQD